MDWLSRNGRRLGVTILGPPVIDGRGTPVLDSGLYPFLNQGPVSPEPIIQVSGSPAITTVANPQPSGVYYIQSPTPATSSALPGGTWQQSCQNAYMVGDTLYAMCERVDGTFVPSSLPNVSSYVANSIYNQDGVLGGQLQTQTPGSVVIPLPVSTTPPPAPVQVQNTPWSPSTYYQAGSTVFYNGQTWVALNGNQGVYPGSDFGQYWFSAYGAAGPLTQAYLPYPGYGYQTYSPYGSPTQPVSSAPSTSTVSGFLSQYGWWIGGGLLAAIVLPRVLGGGRR